MTVGTKHDNPWGLSLEEFLVLQALAGPARGVSKLAAAHLHIETATVHKRVGRILRKTGLANRIEAIRAFDRAYPPAPVRPGPITHCPSCRGLGFVQAAA